MPKIPYWFLFHPVARRCCVTVDVIPNCYLHYISISPRKESRLCQDSFLMIFFQNQRISFFSILRHCRFLILDFCHTTSVLSRVLTWIPLPSYLSPIPTTPVALPIFSMDRLIASPDFHRPSWITSSAL